MNDLTQKLEKYEELRKSFSDGSFDLRGAAKYNQLSCDIEAEMKRLKIEACQHNGNFYVIDDSMGGVKTCHNVPEASSL